MEIIKCKNCGAQLDITKANGRVVECEFCHSKHTLAKSTNEKAAEFLHMGEHGLDMCKFDDAYLAFSKAAECDKSEPEAFFGMALAQHKVQYIKDVKNDRMQPICHDVTDKLFGNNKYFQKALELATPEQRAEYARRGEEIDYIRSLFYRMKQAGIEYDCFICVKVTDDVTKRKTMDSERANDIYYHLKDRGYRPFYSEREIQNQQGADYEAQILYALFSAPCMLVVCSDESYLQTPWVKNEYTRFISLINDEQKEADSITICFFDYPVEKLPGRNGRLQGVCLKNPDAYSKIVDFVDRHFQLNAQAPQITRKSYDNTTYQKKSVIKSQIQKRTLATFAQTDLSVSEQSQLNTTKALLSNGEFGVVNSRCTSLLETNKSCSEAYWCLFLAQNNCRNADEFITAVNKIEGLDNLESAIATANDQTKGVYYSALFRRAKRDRKLYIYNEYVSLPESPSKEIAELTELMFQDLLKGNLYDSSVTIFNTIIKTVEDTDKFEEMNLKFADKLFAGNKVEAAIQYYNKVLEYNPANQRTLWRAFVIKNSLYTEKQILDYLSVDGNVANIENELFQYGFNEFVIDKLFDISLKAIGNGAYQFKWFDSLFSLIPANKEELYVRYLQLVVEKFLSAGMFLLASKYNDMIIAADKLNDKAYLNRVCVSHKVRDKSGLMHVCDSLYDDPDYAKAIDAYAERNIGVPNVYIQLVNQLKVAKNDYDRRIAIEKQKEQERARQERLAREEQERKERLAREQRERDAARAHKAWVRRRASNTIQWVLYLTPVAVMSLIMLVAFIYPTVIFHSVHYGWSIGLYIAIPGIICLIAIFCHHNITGICYKGRRLAIVLLCNLAGVALMIIRMVTISNGTISLRSVYDFEAIDNMPMATTYKLTRDVDFNNKEFSTIKNLPQHSTFDGGGHTISNIVFVDACEFTGIVEDYGVSDYRFGCGLFALCEGTVMDLTIENVEIRVEASADTDYDYLYAGAICGMLYGGTIQDCKVIDCFIDLSEAEGFKMDQATSALPGLCGYVYPDQDGEIKSCEVSGYKSVR